MVQIHIERPLMSVKEYAKLMGVSPQAIRHKICRGQIPVVRKKGARPMINLALMAKEAVEAKI